MDLTQPNYDLNELVSHTNNDFTIVIWNMFYVLNEEVSDVEFTYFTTQHHWKQ